MSDGFEPQRDYENRSGMNRRVRSTENDLIKDNFRTLNTVIVIINVIVFFIMDHNGGMQNVQYILDHGALNAQKVRDDGEVYRLLTYMFMHGGIEHLLNNMLILWIIGGTLEKQLGHVKYLLAYFGTGIIAGVVSIGYNIYVNQDIVGVGASGAVFGVVGALAAVIMKNRGRVENISAKQMLLFIALSLYGGFSHQGIDNAAHIGGLVAGFLLGLLLYRVSKWQKFMRSEE